MAKKSFLAAGESQLKEHSCWMIYEEPDRGFTADMVRENMGDFGHIRVGGSKHGVDVRI